MTYQDDFTLPENIVEVIASQGLDGLPELIRHIINLAMQAERQQYLNAAPYQRTPEREAHANGYKSKTMRTRVGEITFAVPQVREGGFYPQALEKGLRSERALTLALAEMYVQGVSTRKVKAITEQLCGMAISSAQVSHAAALLDADLEKWRERPLGEYPFLFLDAYYEQVREDGQVRDLAVLVAVGVNPQGKREILGVSVSLSEHKVHVLRMKSTGGPFWRASSNVAWAACSSSPATIMLVCEQPGWQSSAASPGRGANSTCSRTRRLMCRISICR
jgi:putative transposase